MHVLKHIFNVTHYDLNPYSIAPLLVATLVLIFGLFLYFLDRKSYFNQTLLYFCLASATWLYSCVLILNSRLPEVATIIMTFTPMARNRPDVIPCNSTSPKSGKISNQ